MDATPIMAPAPAPDASRTSRTDTGRPASASVRVLTMGRFEVLIEGVPAIRLRGRASNLLQALVAHGPGFVSQERLAADLWERADGDAALNALEITVHRLRAALGGRDTVLVRDRRLALSNAGVWVDAHALEAALSAHDAQAVELAPEHVVTAVQLYRGDFLVSETTASWMLPMRERLRNRLVRMLENVANRTPTARDADWRIQIFRQAIVVDPINEACHRGLMQALATAGRTLEAAEVYARYERMAMSWSGSPPSARMRAMAAELRRHGDQ